MTGAVRALEGVTVVTMAEQYPGPYATLLLADMGANVINVERPQGGDPSRIYPDFYAALARNKRSVSLDLKSPEGYSGLTRLLTKADIFMEGFRPGVMARLGLDYERAREINPSLIYLSISGYGQSGPYRDRTGHDMSYEAVAGHLFEHAAVGAPPPIISYADIAAGMFGALAAVTALYARGRTGLGTHIDISMADCLVSWMTSFVGPALNGKASLPVRDIPSYGCFAAADNLVLTLSIAHEDDFWKTLCDVMNLPYLSDLDYAARRSRSDEIRIVLAQAFRQRPFQEWATLFDKSGIPWGPLHDLAGVCADPHFQARGLFAAIPAADEKARRHVVQPMKFSAYENWLRYGAPHLGEHNDQILPPMAPPPYEKEVKP